MGGYLNVVGVGEALDWLKQVPSGSVDSVVTDAPYGMSSRDVDVVGMTTAWASGRDFAPAAKAGFNHHEWDAFVPNPSLWREVYRVLKPGAWCLSMFSARTQDLGALSMRFAGLEILDTIAWVYAGGAMPKSMNIGKAIDAYLATGGSDSKAIKHANDEVRVGEGRGRKAGRNNGIVGEDSGPRVIRDEAATPEAAAWAGWGTGLAPRYEPIIMARKPLLMTHAETALEHGTGALNIDACRLGDGGDKGVEGDTSKGRWPGNVVVGHSQQPACKLIGRKTVGTGSRKTTKAGQRLRQGGHKTTGEYFVAPAGFTTGYGAQEVDEWECAPGCPAGQLDARFFFTAKPSARERMSYCRACAVAFPHEVEDVFEEHDAHKDQVVTHTTQKPIALMEWLVRLVTQPGGVVLDPFCGTGSTAVAAKRLGFNFITCDRDPIYAKIAEARLALVGAGERPKGAVVFCPGCKAKGELKVVEKAVVEALAENGKKVTCPKCMKRFSRADLEAQ